jgi:tripartite-type tricarboxylate transporter receptor subunit TctC
MTGTRFNGIRVALAVCIAASGYCAAPALAAARSDYPNKPIRMVIPFAAGGFSDVVGRIVTQKMSENMGQPVVSDNRPGASGIIGSEIVVRALPDGYTLLLNSFNHVVNPSLMRLPFDPIKDFTSIAMIAGGPPLVMMVHPSSPIKSVKDLIAQARQRPGQLNYGSSGIGTSGHLIGELFKQRAGVNLVHVAYKSSGASMTAILAGEVNMVSAYMPVVLPQVQSGKLRGLAVTSARRSPVLPDLPTMAEAGVKGVEVIGFAGLLGPPKMPAHLVKRLHAETVKLAKDPDFVKRYAAYDMETVATTGDEFVRYMRGQIDLWAEVVKSAGIKNQ